CVGDDESGAAHLVEHLMLEGRRNIGQQHERRLAIRLGQIGGEGFKHAQLGRQRPAVVHIDFVLAGPMEGLSRRQLQSAKVDAMAAVKLDVAPKKSSPTMPTSLTGAKK